MVIQPLLTRLIKPNQFYVLLSHRRRNTVSLATRNLFFEQEPPDTTQPRKISAVQINLSQVFEEHCASEHLNNSSFILQILVERYASFKPITSRTVS